MVPDLFTVRNAIVNVNLVDFKKSCLFFYYISTLPMISVFFSDGQKLLNLKRAFKKLTEEKFMAKKTTKDGTVEKRREKDCFSPL